MMQSFAEGFAIMDAKKPLELDLPQIAEIWRVGSVVRSWLLDLTAEALKHNPELEGIAPYVTDSGEGRWTVFEAIDLNVSAPGHHRVAHPPPSLARGEQHDRPYALGHAQRLWRSRHQEGLIWADAPRAVRLEQETMERTARSAHRTLSHGVVHAAFVKIRHKIRSHGTRYVRSSSYAE